jgi:hypothetical protein
LEHGRQLLSLDGFVVVGLWLHVELDWANSLILFVIGGLRTHEPSVIGVIHVEAKLVLALLVVGRKEVVVSRRVEVKTSMHFP